MMATQTADRRQHGPELLLLSRADVPGLISSVDRLAARLRDGGAPPLRALALEHGRSPASTHRLALVASSHSELEESLLAARRRLSNADGPFRVGSGLYYGKGKSSGGVAVMFPGIGSTYQGMVRELSRATPVTRRWLEELDRAYVRATGGSPFRAEFEEAEEEPACPSTVSPADEAKLGLVASLGLHDLLARLRVPVTCYLGHSNGEHAAMIASGAFKFGGASDVCEYLVGVNAAPFLGRDSREAVVAVSGVRVARLKEILSAAGGDVFIACDNCPTQVLVAGRSEAVEAAAGVLKKAGAQVFRLPSRRAHHTPLFREGAAELREEYEKIEIATPSAPVYSCALVGRHPHDARGMLDAMSWQWLTTVRFRETVELLYEQYVRVFVEVGPGNKLTGFVKDTLRGQPHLAVSMSSGVRPEAANLRHFVAELYAWGVGFDIAGLDTLLDEGPRAEATASAPVVSRNVCIRLDERPHLRDHAFAPHGVGSGGALVVLPFVEAAALVAQTAAEAGLGPVTVLRNLRAHRWLTFGDGPAGESLNVESRAAPADAAGEQMSVQLFQRIGDENVLSFEGTAASAAVRAEPGAPFKGVAAGPVGWTAERFYDEYAFHGPAFRRIRKVLHVGPASVVAELTRREGSRAAAFDPTLADCAGQLAALWLLETTGEFAGVFPFMVRELLQYFGPDAYGPELICQGFLSLRGGQVLHSDFEFVEPAGGRVALAIRGLEQRLVRLPENYWRFLFKDGEMSGWLSAGLHASRDACARVLRREEWRFLSTNWGLWADALARRILSDAELSAWREVPTGEPRADWLLRRVVAKEAVRCWALQRGEGVSVRGVTLEGGDGGVYRAHGLTVSVEDDGRSLIARVSGG